MKEEALIQPISDSRFKFACYKTLPCFTVCCANLNLVLTPYDVLRLKNSLKLSSKAFLERYTTCHVEQTNRVPLVKLKMNDDKNRSCPFVHRGGCSVYYDRPGACRIYPLGRAASKIHEGHKAGEYYFMVKEPHCLGFNEEKEWTVQEWIKDQGLNEYNAMNDLFIDMVAGKYVKAISALSEQELQMFYMACYSLDEFRNFIFQSTFLDRFDIKQDVIVQIKKSDIELMKFGCGWLQFSLFGEKTIAIRAKNA